MIGTLLPDTELTYALLPHAASTADGAHDAAHLLRVWRNAARIANHECGGDRTVLQAAVLLHDCVLLPRDSPNRRQASRRSAEKAAVLLHDLGWKDARIEKVRHAVAAHSWPAEITPRTFEARILRDADRLNALGFVGVARCFYVAGAIGAQLYNPPDRTAETRPLDGSRFALDHFRMKLFQLGEGFCTDTGRRMPENGLRRLRDYVDGLLFEIGGDCAPVGTTR